MRIHRVLLLVLLLAAPLSAQAQTRSIISNLANPAIGMSALFLAQAAPQVDSPYGIKFQEAELSVISTVDPYWTLAANLVFEGDPATGIPDSVSAEEAYATTDSIPNITFKIGEIRAAFGKHGLLHTHAFPFIQAPIIMGNTLGQEGFKDAGVEAAWLTPLPWYCELTLGGYGPVAASGDHPLDFNSSSHDNIPYLLHLKNLFDVDDDTTMELGGSALTGMGDDGLHHAVYGADFTLRNVPLQQSNQKGWILQSEYIKKVAFDGSGAFSPQAEGWYASFQYRWGQEWWSGIRAEECYGATPDLDVDSTENSLSGNVKRASINVAWLASEFSQIKAEYSYAQNDAGQSDNRAMLQFNYVIGFHPPHAY